MKISFRQFQFGTGQNRRPVVRVTATGDGAQVSMAVAIRFRKLVHRLCASLSELLDQSHRLIARNLERICLPEGEGDAASENPVTGFETGRGSAETRGAIADIMKVPDSIVELSRCCHLAGRSGRAGDSVQPTAFKICVLYAAMSAPSGSSVPERMVREDVRVME